MTTQPLIVLSLEALLPSSLGCYGSSWNQTPSIDQIASAGCLWDRWISSSDQPHAVLTQLLGGNDGWMDGWRRSGETELITDVESIAAMANGFDSVAHVQRDPVQGAPAQDDDVDKAATEIEQTQFAAMMAAAIERDVETDGDWSLMWLHSDFLTRCWDAPRSLYPIDEVETQSALEPWEEEELSNHPQMDLDSLPLIIESARVPHLDLSKPPVDDLAADDHAIGWIGNAYHPDVITMWMRTYACQVRLIDWLIEILLQSLLCEDPRVMILGTSGFSMGQNGHIGHRAGPLRSHDLRLPIIVSDTGPVRMPRVMSDQTLPNILRDLGRDDTSWCGPTAWTANDEHNLVKTETDRARHVITSDDWFFVEDNDGSEHLFLKPDDIDDFNDVARLRPHVIDELKEQVSQTGPATSPSEDS